MISRYSSFIALIYCVLITSTVAAQSAAFRPSPLPELTGADDKFMVVQLHGDLTMNVAAGFKHLAIKARKDDKVRAIILDLDSSRGDVNAAEMVLKDMSSIQVPTYVYVNSTAIGPAAILTFGGDGIFMAPNARMGAIVQATPVAKDEDGKEIKSKGADAYQLSTVKSLIRAYAQANGYREEVGEAMADPAFELKYGDIVIAQEDDVLTLTANEARRTMADGAALHCHDILTDLDQLIKNKKLGDAERVNETLIGDAGIYRDAGAEAPPADVEHAAPKLSGKGDKVLILKLHDDFNQTLLYHFRRGFRLAKEDKTIRAVVIDMDTPGGRVDVLKEISAFINACEVPVYLYVEDMAISAGAILSFATQGIYMKEGSQIGAAALVISGGGGVQDVPESYREKLNSFMRSHVRAMAQKNGYREKVGEAMVDSSVELTIAGRVLCPKGKLLTLTAREATEIMPDGKPLHAHKIVKDLDEVLAIKGLDKAEKIELETTASEKLARFIVMISPLLAVLGLICFYIEARTPGFGVFGITALCCWGLLVFGHHIAEAAGFEAIILVVVGGILLLIEFFVIPGFGVCGVSGIVCMAVGFVWMMIPELPNEPLPVTPGVISDVPSVLSEHLLSSTMYLIYTMVLAAVAFFGLSYLLPKTPMFNQLVHQGAATDEAGFNATDEAVNMYLVGMIGVAKSVLRPSGIATIDGKRIDVVAEGAFIKAGQKIKVKAVKGVRIVVVPVTEQDNEA